MLSGRGAIVEGCRIQKAKEEGGGDEHDIAGGR
jgi:hypothetical protein